MSRKILVIGPAWVGDMIMAQCLFQLLKQSEPAIQIDVLAPSWTFSLLSRMPEITNAILLPINHGELKIWQRLRMANRLRKAQYTQAIVLPNSFKSALIPWLAGIPKRTGWLGEYRWGLLNDARHLNKDVYRRMIDQFMALGLSAHSALPKPNPLPRLAINLTSRNELLRRLNLMTDEPILALCPGAAFGSSKRWLPEYYAQTANQKLLDGWQVWVFGADSDRPFNEQIMQQTKNQCRNLTGLLNLDETIDLLSLATHVITNDSGLMHIACALDKSVIAIYGSTSPDFTPPLSPKAKVLKLNLPCQPCFQRVCPLKHHRCMKDLSPQQVLEALSTDHAYAHSDH